MWDDKGLVPTPDNAMKNANGSWIDPSSLANTVNYVYEQTGKPILVTEHGIDTKDDSQRADFIESSLIELQKIIHNGVLLF